MKTSFSPLAAAALAAALAACDGGGGSGTPAPPPDACSACRYHTLVWSDEFEAEGAPDAASWGYHVGAGWNAGAGGFLGWGNAELEWYRPEQAVQRGGQLVITADRDASRPQIAGRDTTVRSARLVTQGKRSWSRARVEARIAMPSVAGTWPAFWLMGDTYDGSSTSELRPADDRYDTMATTWPACGEIDIMEHRNTDGSTVQNVFWDTRTSLEPWDAGTIDDDPGQWPAASEVPLDPTAFHVYAVEWTDAEMYWYVDGVRVKTLDISAENQEELNGAEKKFFVLLNLAIGGPDTAFTGRGPTPAASDYPLRMYVDWVRVYQ